MRQWSSYKGSLLIALIGLTPVCFGCEAPPSGYTDAGSDAGLDTASDARLKVISFKQVHSKGLREPEHHPQSPFMKGGALENFHFFYGKLKDQDGTGKRWIIEAKKIIGNHHDPSKQIVPAILEGGQYSPDDSSHVNFALQSDDPCPRDEQLELVGQLPLYLITDDDHNNYCTNQIVTVTDPSELARCAPKNSSPQQQIDAFNKIHELAVAVPGYWSNDGKYHADDNGEPVVTLACITGIVAKCAHWGYVPWLNYHQKPLGPYHRACARGARAEYLSDGDSYTCAHNKIDIFDNLRIQDSRGVLEDESYWDENGPKCIKHSRYKACDSRVGPDAGACDSSARPDAGACNPNAAPEAGGCTWKVGIASQQDYRLPWDKDEPPKMCPQGKASSNFVVDECKRR